MKVWIVVADEWGEYMGICGVFDTEEKAENFIKENYEEKTFSYEISEEEIK